MPNGIPSHDTFGRVFAAYHHCQEALSLSQQLGIPLTKDCEELLVKIQGSLGESQ